MNKMNGRIILAVLTCFTWCNITLHAEEKKSILYWDYLTGDWGGVRTDLDKKGLHLEFFYAAAVPSNLEGGLDRGSVYEGVFYQTTDLDLEKWAGWNATRFHFSLIYPHGEAFSRDYVGDLNVVSLLDLPKDFRLWKLYVEKGFFDKKLSLKLGQLAVDEDFFVSSYLADFSLINQSFLLPTLPFNVPLPATPNTAPGVRLKMDATKSCYLQAGIYDGNPGGFADPTTGEKINNNAGIEYDINDDEGYLAYLETGYRLNPDGKDGMPGAYKIGGYYHSDDFYDNYEDANGDFYLITGNPPEVHEGNYGFYALVEQQVYRENSSDDPANQGLAVIARYATAPKDRNLFTESYDGAIVYKGLFPGRDWDTIAFAASYLEISDDISQLMRDAGVTPVADYEGLYEANYKFQMTAWWTLQASLQRVIHPGGSEAIDDATVFIVQTTLRF